MLAVSICRNASAIEASRAPRTLEEQITYLEGALAESLRARDLGMLELAVKGLKTAGLAGKDLEISVLRAEREASWTNLSAGYALSTPAPSLEVWGWIARAKLGDARAVPALRELTGDIPRPAPLPAWDKTPAAEYNARRKEAEGLAARAARGRYAFFALALLKEPGIAEKAFAAMPAKEQDLTNQIPYTWQYGNEVSPLVLAVLTADPEKGLGKLIARLSDEKISVKEQSAELYEFFKLTMPNNYGAADDPLSAVGEIRQKVSKEVQATLPSAFVSLLKRYPFEDKQQYDPTIQLLLSFGTLLPEKSLPADSIATLEDFIKRMPKSSATMYKPTLDNILRRQGKEPALSKPGPVKPPKPPDEKEF